MRGFDTGYCNEKLAHKAHNICAIIEMAYKARFRPIPCFGCHADQFPTCEGSAHVRKAKELYFDIKISIKN